MSSQILFNHGVLPGLGPTVYPSQPAPSNDTRILDWFLSKLRLPFLFAYVLVLFLAVMAVVQEGEQSWGSTQGYATPDCFTDLFEPPNNNPIERPAMCTTKLLSYDNTDCYTVCGNRWHGLDIMDLSLAASMAYINITDTGNGKEIIEMLNDPAGRLPEDGEGDWTILHNNHASPDWVAFLDIYSPSRNLSVIAVRGSSPRFIDWLEDMSLFGEMTIFSLLSGAIPGLLYWPPGFFHSFLNTYTSTVGGIFGDGVKFFTPVVTYSEASFKSLPRDAVFVGHSLGGAVAKIAGSLVDKPAVGISSPGIMDSRKKFVHGKNYVRTYQVRKLVTNVYSQGDYVPAVGRLGGGVHELYCSEGAQCHSLPVTLCELNLKCPAGASGKQFVGSKRQMIC